ncbi:MAG TPA: hypothetical protein VFU97_17505 [Xanthobacteraceae bacterium]|jgi:hypothetical protein|nr:hypothetical protein [Xanthobacteraceae bacterium]
MSHSLRTAGATTHLKVVVVALIASLTVMVVGLTARPQADTSATQVVRAGQLLLVAGTPGTAVR